MGTLRHHAAAILLMLAAGSAGADDKAGDIVVVVSAQNPVGELTRAQVADIFLGRTQQFPNGSPAVPIDQSEGSAARESFNSGVLGRSSAQVRAHWAKILFTGRGRPPATVRSSAEVVQSIASNPRAIGYIERSQADATVLVVLE